MSDKKKSVAKRSRTTSDSATNGNVDKKGRPSATVENWKNRQWITLQPPPVAKSSASMDFSIMSYNILSQDLLEDNSYLYSGADAKNLEWSQRRGRILSEIKYYSPDVICLQEAQQDHYEQSILPEFQQLGYQGLYKKRTNDKPDGCALLYKEDKFKLIDSTLVEFQMGYGELLNRDNVAIVAILESVKTQRPAQICIATTHLLFNHKRGDVKLGQVCLLLAQVEKLTKAALEKTSNSESGESTIPVILTGDFNSTPYSHLYNFMLFSRLVYEGLYSDDIAGSGHGRSVCLKRGLLPPRGVNKNCQFEPDPAIQIVTPSISHPFNLLSAYAHFTQRRGRNCKEITTHHGRADTTVDYIFYSIASKQTKPSRGGFLYPVNIVEDRLKLVARLDLLTSFEAQEAGSLPNGQFGSDHLCLMCKFRLILPPPPPVSMVDK